MTAAIIVLVLVAMQYGQGFLSSSMAQNEFSTNQQFMVTTGLQIDNVAWLMGRAQTVRYSSTYGSLQLKSGALNYTIQMYQGSTLVANLTLQTGIILYNVPVTEYSLGNNYVQAISSSNNSFVQVGSTAPVTYVYSIQKVPMSDGSFARTVVVPTIRMMNTMIGTQNYTELYLPLLQNGTNLGLSQSVTLVSQNVNQIVQSSVSKVTFTEAFPLAAQGFNSGFFPFATTSITETLTNSTVELYTGEVSASVGLYS
jgi:hypothetical protein